MASFQILTDAQVTEGLESLPDWKVIDGKLAATYLFPDFKTAIAFITMVAFESEASNHHPEWCNAYNKVEFAFSTHDAGGKITDLDIDMAKRISKAAALFQK